MDLPLDQALGSILSLVLDKTKGIEVRAAFHGWDALISTKGVDDEIVGYPHDPGNNLAFLIVVSPFDSNHRFYKNVLKQVFGQLTIVDHHADVTVDPVLVPAK